MRLRHFETLRPICPVCYHGTEEQHPLKIGSVAREEREHILEGVLLCPNPHCQREYPIIDGIPILVEEIREYIAGNILAISGRGDFSETIESLLGDCCGLGSPYDTQRQQLSSYAWDHYAEFDPAEVESQAQANQPQPGGVVRLLDAGLELCHDLPTGPLLDVGCGPGRTSFALAERRDEIVLGIDLNFTLLRLATSVLRTGQASYPRRQVGVVYDRREFPVPTPRAENVDFWACDASQLPFPKQSFAAAVALNVLDSVRDPLALLSSLDKTLLPGGQAILACPYDWSAAVTPIESWLGGHSQRSVEHGRSEAVLRRLLAPVTRPPTITRLHLTAEIDHFPWHVRLHSRSHVHYDVHVVVAHAAYSGLSYG